MTPSADFWAGLAGAYDSGRPAPPPILADILTQLARTPRPRLVVDLGCGTGLSTLLWAGRAGSVIGIEPSDDMRAQAARRLAASPNRTGITFQSGSAQHTGLETASADIITCSQSFHWMEPVATLLEVARVLRPRGVFAVYDYDWPPCVDAELDATYEDVNRRAESLIAVKVARELEPPRWPKDQHLMRVRASEHFGFVRQIAVHHRVEGDANRYIGLLRSGDMNRMLQRGVVTAEEFQLDRLERTAQRCIGSVPVPWYFSYQVVLGVRR